MEESDPSNSAGAAGDERVYWGIHWKMAAFRVLRNETVRGAADHSENEDARQRLRRKIPRGKWADA